MQRRCEEAKTPYNGLKLEANTVLRIANIKGKEWMLPIELDSIKRGLKFGEKKYSNATYTGYFNADGQKEGAGVRIFESGTLECGEYHCDKANGIGKCEFPSGNTYWGQWKDNKREGYGTEYYASNRMTYTGQLKNDNKHGYGHTKWESGAIYHGQWKEDSMEGYGFYKWPDGNEYDG